MQLRTHAETRSRFRSRVIAGSLVALVVGASAVLVMAASGGSAPEDGAHASLSPQRQMLAEGYSLLHTDANHLKRVGLLLYAKSESDEVNSMVSAIASYAKRLEGELEDIQGSYPGVRIDLQPLPEMELRKRWAIAKGRAWYFAPGFGHGGREYERTLLIGLANGINHQRHLCLVMAEEEPDTNLKKFLILTGRRYEDLQTRVVSLLEREYFRDPGTRAPTRDATGST